MKKLLIMASLFWPQRKGGGPPVSIMNLVQALHKDYSIYVIANNFEIHENIPLEGVHEGVNHFEFGTVYYLSRNARTMGNIFRIIESIQPDIIYQNSFFSYCHVFPVLRYKKLFPKVKVIITPRGEFQKKALDHGKLKKRLYVSVLKHLGCLRNIQWQFAAQSELDNWQRFSRLNADSLYVLPNLTYSGQISADRTKEPGELRLCFVGRIHPHKNLLYALDVLSNVAGNVVFDIYGSHEDLDYYTTCLQRSKQLPSNIRCSFKGCVDNDVIHKVIGTYHSLFLPTKSEAYGQSLVEAMLTAVPVITSTGTPWNDIIDSNAGYALDLEAPESFAAAINELIKMDNEAYFALTQRTENFIREKLQTDDTIAAYRNMFG